MLPVHSAKLVEHVMEQQSSVCRMVSPGRPLINIQYYDWELFIPLFPCYLCAAVGRPCLSHIRVPCIIISIGKSKVIIILIILILLCTQDVHHAVQKPNS
jgi:hypothetical protein